MSLSKSPVQRSGRDGGTVPRRNFRLCAALRALAPLSLTLCTVQPSPAEIRPSQVLVLYNENWKGDAPLTHPGQDSLEIARHYIELHTDPGTGEKPYLLGLRCRHGGGHLDGSHLPEASRDNPSGVVLRREGKLVGAAGEVRDSRAVEFGLPKNQGPWDFRTLNVRLHPKNGEAISLADRGRGAGPGVVVQPEGDWNLRANGRELASGPFVAEATCEDAEGKSHHWRAEYQDVMDVACSRTGPDDVRDDQNYLEDAEIPVKEFLEDPRNAVSDGTLLREHILFIVVCYGLPKTAAATYGIARGITDRLSDHGAMIDFGQRLQLLYYNVEQALGWVPRAHRFETAEPFSAFYFRAPQAWPLIGRGANPFAHPLAYQKDKGPLDRLPSAVGFTPARRTASPERHLYFSMRIDGVTPLEALGMADRSAYASRFGGPAMGVLEGLPLEKSKDRTGSIDHNRAGELLWGRGFRHLFYRDSSSSRLDLFRLMPGLGFLNRAPVFLPGGIGATVESHQGWNRADSAFLRNMGQGVTFTLGAARVYQGAPHIHNRSWWDDEILYPCLLSGRTLGECLLENQVHLEWISCFVGDPLYRLPADPVRDTSPPAFEPGGIRAQEHEGPEGRPGVWVRVHLASPRGSPEVAQLEAIAEGEGWSARCETFEASPYAFLGPPEAVYGKVWLLRALDPFGNRSELSLLLSRP